MRRSAHAYKDSEHISFLITLARAEANLPARTSLWKQVARARRDAQRQWKQQLLQAAAGKDWRAFKRLRPPAKAWMHNIVHHHGGLETTFDKMYRHFFDIFSSSPSCPATLTHIRHLDTACHQTDFVPFDPLEIDIVQGQLKSGKTSGADGVPSEVWCIMASLPEGMQLLLQVCDDLLRRGRWPQCWTSSVVVLLNKVPKPTEWKQTRPIALQPTLSKFLVKLVMMNRLAPSLLRPVSWQHAFPGRQPTDVIFAIQYTLYKVREWSGTACIIKLDVEKAFDKVSHGPIAQTLLHRCPDQPYETRFLLTSLVDKRLNFSFFDNQFSIPQGNGVPQGGCQSPGLFAAVIDDLLADLHATWLRRGFHCVLPFSIAIMALAYMDDIYLLAPTLHQASLMLQDVSHQLAKKGLRIQPAKTQLMVSPNLQGSEPLPSDFDSLLQVEQMKVLGKMISFRQLSPEVPFLLSNGCSSWGIHREVLCCKDAPLKHRLHLFQQLVGEVILWCAATILPLKSNLRKLNGLQFRLVATMLRLRRRTGEPWLDFQHRRYGMAKLTLFRLSIPRWSTLLLKRIWSYAGHCSRQTAQGPWASAASVVVHTHTLQQWEHIRILHRHPGRFTPVLRKWEESICRTLGTTDWHPAAQDRDRWRQSEAAYLRTYDIPWYWSQPALEDGAGWEGLALDGIHQHL